MKKVKLLPLLITLGLSLSGCVAIPEDGATGPQGPVGPTGATGPQGPQGPSGIQGEDGETPYIGSNGNWWIGSIDTGVPAAGQDGQDGQDGKDGQDGQDGQDGDKGDKGDKGDTGAAGEPGKDGTAMHTGHGAPSSSLGQSGDSYIDLDTWDFYVKGENGWTKEGNIKGTDGEDYEREMHTVTFETSGGTVIASQQVLHGEKAKKPADPVKQGQDFLGWTYLDEPWFFNGGAVTEDMTLVAEWDWSYESLKDLVRSATAASLEVTQYGSTTTSSLLWGENEHGRTHASSKVESWSGNTVTSYYAFDDSGVPYSYQINGTTLSKDSGTITAAMLDGPSNYIAGTSYYGIPGFLDLIASSMEVNSNKSNKIDGNLFYIEHLVEQYGSKNLTQLELEFMYNNGVLEGVNSKYRSIYSYQLIEDVELGIWYPTDDCTTEFTVNNYSLSFGESTLELPYVISDFYYNSFDVVDKDNNVVSGEFNIPNGEQTQLKIANPSPSGASYQFDVPQVKVLESSTGGATVNFNTYAGAINITPTKIGSLDLEIKTKNVTKVLDLNIVAPTPTGMNMKTYTVPSYSGGNYNASPINGPLTLLENSEILMGAQITPNGAAQEFTLTCSAPEVSITLAAEGVKTYGLSYSVINVDVYKVSASKAGTYTITATAVENPDITADVVINVEAAPTVEDITSKVWWHYYGGSGRAIDENIRIEFAPNADPLTGKVTIYDYYTNKYDGSIPAEEKLITLEHDYSYNAVTRKFTLSSEGSDLPYYLEVTSDYKGIAIKDTRAVADQIAISGFTVQEYDPSAYLYMEWYEDSPRPLGGATIMINKGRGSWDYMIGFDYTYSVNADGSISVNIAEASAEDICTSLAIDSITSLVLDNTYKTLTLTYVELGETKTTTFSN